MSQPAPCILTIFGASGDLTKRKLVPALFDLYRQKLLPEKFAVLGVSRSEYSDDAFRDYMLENVRKYHNGHDLDESLLKRFIGHLYYQAIDTNDAAAYAALKTRCTTSTTSGRPKAILFTICPPRPVFMIRSPAIWVSMGCRFRATGRGGSA